ncbi:MAG: tRNA threonylcarbamoyladenosine dehydratase [Bacteroidaceae bacterium]|nr:tRNA threonylcarbamoyladenosine dehydratase [Bacteroidaceae bacterium]
MTTNQSGNLFERMELLYGKETVNLLSGKTVMVVGIGGVGGYAAELIVRSGVGNIIIIDGDTVEEGNINRQIIALHSTVGKLKTEVMKERLHDINPDATVKAIGQFILPEDVETLLHENPADIIVDAIDSVPTKVELIKQASANGIPIISSMGAGKRNQAEKVCITTLAKTHSDGLSKSVRRAIADKEICNRLPVVFSSQEPMNQIEPELQTGIGSISYIPATFGIYLAQYTINYLLKG